MTQACHDWQASLEQLNEQQRQCRQRHVNYVRKPIFMQHTALRCKRINRRTLQGCTGMQYQPAAGDAAMLEALQLSQLGLDIQRMGCYPEVDRAEPA